MDIFKRDKGLGSENINGFLEMFIEASFCKERLRVSGFIVGDRKTPNNSNIKAISRMISLMVSGKFIIEELQKKGIKGNGSKAKGMDTEFFSTEISRFMLETFKQIRSMDRADS